MYTRMDLQNQDHVRYFTYSESFQVWYPFFVDQNVPVVATETSNVREVCRGQQNITHCKQKELGILAAMQQQCQMCAAY